MATYKVIQDIEAEDKFLGPLTLKQFILAAIAIVSAYLSIIFITKKLYVLAIPFMPVIIVTGFLAFPWGRDQPTETWLLAKIRFYFKPRKRVWNQTGMQELVKITAPPKVQQFTGDNLSQIEVRSRLKALAETIDSRGWAIKNVNVNMYAQPSYGALSVAQGSDRLVDASTLPQVNVSSDVGVDDDIFDSPLADQVASAIEERGHQQKTISKDRMKDAIEDNTTDSRSPDYWFMDQPKSSDPNMAMFGTVKDSRTPKSAQLSQQFSRPAQDDEETRILNELRAKNETSKNSFHNRKSISTNDNISTQKISIPPVTAAPDPVTIELAGNNDRVVSSLARESNKAHPELPDDEVIISLH